MLNSRIKFKLISEVKAALSVCLAENKYVQYKNDQLGIWQD